MTIVDLLLSIIRWIVAFTAIFGLAWFLGHSGITVGIRKIIAGPASRPHPFGSKFIEGIECPACLSWWLAIGFGLTVLDLTGITLFAFALCSMALSFIVGTFTGLIQRVYP